MTSRSSLDHSPFSVFADSNGNERAKPHRVCDDLQVKRIARVTRRTSQPNKTRQQRVRVGPTTNAEILACVRDEHARSRRAQSFLRRRALKVVSRKTGADGFSRRSPAKGATAVAIKADVWKAADVEQLFKLNMEEKRRVVRFRFRGGLENRQESRSSPVPTRLWFVLMDWNVAELRCSRPHLDCEADRHQGSCLDMEHPNASIDAKRAMRDRNQSLTKNIRNHYRLLIKSTIQLIIKRNGIILLLFLYPKGQTIPRSVETRCGRVNCSALMCLRF